MELTAIMMRHAMKPIFVMFVLLASVASLSSCSTSGNGILDVGVDISGNEGGSKALNSREGYELQREVNRCHRTGGTRVVKIKGELKCY